MYQDIILDNFLRNNVLVYTDSDCIGCTNDNENLIYAAEWWAESLQNNLALNIGTKSLPSNLVSEVHDLFKDFDKMELNNKILDVYPENVHWFFDEESQEEFETFIGFFLKAWLEFNE